MSPTSEVMAEVSLALSYQELFRVTGPLQSLVLRAEDMWQRHNQCLEVCGALNQGFPFSPLLPHFRGLRDGVEYKFLDRTILLFHTISARPPKQTRMVRTFLKIHTGLGWRMHCGAEVTESSTNKQHHLSPWLTRRRPGSLYCLSIIENE